MRIILSIVMIFSISFVALPVVPIYFSPVISNINVVSICNNSVAINFRTDIVARSFIEFGTTTGYGTSTIDDPVRSYREHFIQLTGLSAGTQYHYRINVTNNGTTQSSDQTVTTTSGDTTCVEMAPQVDSRMPDMTGAVEKTVKTSGGDYTPAQFNTALSDASTANEKRIITIDAGLTITGQYQMPANADQNWVVIRTSQWANLPEGKRVVPADASKLVKFQNTNVDAPIIFAAAANHYRFIGLEVTIDPAAIADAPAGNPQTAGMFYFYENVATNAANLAKFITIDRCWVHGQPTKSTVRGIQLGGEDIAIIDSYINDFHSDAADAQGILLLAIKRVKILNNLIIGSGENIMWGGSGIGVPGYVVGGLEVLRNHFYHPIEWKENAPEFAGFQWKEKNLFELKTSANTILFGNYFGGTTDSQGGFWPDAQARAINFKLEQNSAVGTCDLFEHLIVYKNFGKNLHAGFAIVGRQNSGGACTNKPERILVKDNLLEIDAQTWTEEPGCSECSVNGTAWHIGGVEDAKVIHNTIVNANPTQASSCNSTTGDGSLNLVGDPTTPKWANFTFKDNIGDYRGCGFSASEAINDATTALNNHFSSYSVTNNGILRIGGASGNFPATQVFATSWSAQVVNFNSGREGNYRVAAASSWHNAASDGTDIGADVDGVELATQFTPTGDWGNVDVVKKCNWASNPRCTQ